MSVETNTSTYDIVIVGAGISGLYAGIKLLEVNRKLKVAITDRYKFLGGRTFTFEADISGVKYQWEEGAARISEKHTLMLDLAKRFKMTLVPIGGDLEFRVSGGAEPESDRFTQVIPAVLGPLTRLSRADLGKTTIRKLLEGIHGPKATDEILIRYPYRAELDTMRADMALELFAGEFRTFSGYYVLKEGFSELVRRMVKEFERRSGKILAQHEFMGLEADGTLKFLEGRPSEGTSRPEVTLVSRRATILAIPSTALQKLPLAAELPWLSHLTMKPLLRVYSVFESGALPTLEKFVTPAVNRFVIPQSDRAIQISYTDSTDAEPLMAMLKEKGAAALGEHLTETLGEILGMKLPKPLFTEAHSWKEGVTYWLPGDYDPAAVSRLASRPLAADKPTLFLCGESYSLRQCWVEGALEHTEQTLGLMKKVLKL